MLQSVLIQISEYGSSGLFLKDAVQIIKINREKLFNGTAGDFCAVGRMQIIQQFIDFVIHRSADTGL